jgi:hypothetical protein
MPPVERKYGGVGKDGVEAAFGIFGGNGVEEFETIAVVEAHEWIFGTED